MDAQDDSITELEFYERADGCGLLPCWPKFELKEWR